MMKCPYCSEDLMFWSPINFQGHLMECSKKYIDVHLANPLRRCCDCPDHGPNHVTYSNRRNGPKDRRSESRRKQ